MMEFEQVFPSPESRAMRHCRHAGFGLVAAVAFVFVAHVDAAAQGPGAPGAMNPRLGGNRGAGVGGGAAGSSVPMMAPQRSVRRSPTQSFNPANSASSTGTRFRGFYSREAVSNQVKTGGLLRTSDAIKAQAKTVNVGPMGMGSIQAR